MPAAKHWIVTTRKVQSDGSVSAMVKDAEPTFRIAESFLPTLNDEDNAFLASVKWIPDTTEFVDFGTVNPATVDLETLKGTQRLFVALYKAMLQASESQQKGDILFFIHGFDYTWTDNLRHLRQLHDLYVEDPKSPIGSIVYFSWPSYGDVKYYDKDQRNALISGTALGRLFIKLNEFYDGFFSRRADGTTPKFCGKKIHLAAHSMGNQVLEEMFRSMNQSDWVRKNFIQELVMLHADAQWDCLEPGKPLAQAPDYAERIHVYNHKNDNALLISERTKNIGTKRIGRQGPRDAKTVPPRTLIVDTTSDNSLVQGIGAALLEQIGIGRQSQTVANSFGESLKEASGNHWGYLFRKQVIQDLIHVFNGVSASQIPTRESKGLGENLYRIKPRD
jgi:hypothetical protein